MTKNLYLDPGKLRHRLQLLTAVDVSDGSGGLLQNWQTVGEVWADISVATATQIEEGAHNRSLVSYTIDLRQPSTVRAGNRLVHDATGRTFEITNTYDPDETGRYLRCLCEEKSE